jgi:hypothetical protein
VNLPGKMSPAKTPDLPPPAGPAAAGPSLSNLPSFGSAPKPVPAAEMTVIWRRYLDELPDPSRNGQMVPGLAGQMFVFTDALQPTDANGTLTVDMIDLTPRQPGVGPPPLLPERWQFDKEALRKLLSPDEKWGRGYVVFLPWKAFRPDVTRVQISVRFDQEGGHPLYVKPEVVDLRPKEVVTASTLPNVPASALPRPQQIPGGLPLGAAPPNAWPGPGVVQTGGMMPANAMPQALPPSMTGVPAPQVWTPPAAPNGGFAPQPGFPQPGMPMMPINQGAAAWPSSNPLAPNGIAVPGMNPTGGGIGQGVMVINRMPQQPAPPAQPVVPAGYR